MSFDGWGLQTLNGLDQCLLFLSIGPVLSQPKRNTSLLILSKLTHDERVNVYWIRRDNRQTTQRFEDSNRSSWPSDHSSSIQQDDYPISLQFAKAALGALNLGRLIHKSSRSHWTVTIQLALLDIPLRLFGFIPPNSVPGRLSDLLLRVIHVILSQRWGNIDYLESYLLIEVIVPCVGCVQPGFDQYGKDLCAAADWYIGGAPYAD